MDLSYLLHSLHSSQITNGHFKNGLVLRTTFWPKFNLIYIRIPKCGNQAIRASIPGGQQLVLEPEVLAHHNAINRPFTFSFVRNPWARLVSTWAEKIRTTEITDEFFYKGVSRSFIQSEMPFHFGISFAAFVEMACEIDDITIDNHLKPQSFFIVREGRVLPDFIGRVESFGSGWAYLTQRIGQNFLLLHKNSSEHAHYSSYYNDYLINLVGDRYGNDIDCFKYDFERKEEFVA